MPPNGRIIDLALLLRSAAPDTWEQFTGAMREYAAAMAVDMIRCPPELLTRAQGMAIAANEIASVLQNAPKLKENSLHGQPTSRKPAGQFANT